MAKKLGRIALQIVKIKKLHLLQKHKFFIVQRVVSEISFGKVFWGAQPSVVIPLQLAGARSLAWKHRNIERARAKLSTVHLMGFNQCNDVMLMQMNSHIDVINCHIHCICKTARASCGEQWVA